eukprot:1092758-Lingulodinium_polyedra.AAC.1
MGRAPLQTTAAADPPPRRSCRQMHLLRLRYAARGRETPVAIAGNVRAPATGPAAEHADARGSACRDGPTH